ncbi:malonate transporter, partial [Fusobacterium animalis ATCC 51191]
NNMGDLSTLSFDNLKLLAYAFISILIVLFLAWLIYMPNVKDRKKLSVLIQGVYRGNFVLFGLAIADSLYGKESLGTVSLLTAIVIPTFNVIAVILLEYYSGNEVNKIKIN